MLKIDEMAAPKVSIFYVFWQNCQNASLIYLPNLTTLYIQLDLGTRIPNLQSESKNVENWRNGGLKSVDFWRFLGKMAKRVTYLSTETLSTVYLARSRYPNPKSSIGIEECWKLAKRWPKMCWFFYVFMAFLNKMASNYLPICLVLSFAHINRSQDY